MDRKHLIQQLQAYIPFNEQEKKDKRIFLEQLNIENIFQRENEVGHFTASCWIVNQDHTKVLLAYHNFFQSYAWLGGHCDGDEDCLRTLFLLRRWWLMDMKKMANMYRAIFILM